MLKSQSIAAVIVLSGAVCFASGKDESLIDAVKAGNSSVVQKVLQSRVDPNDAEADGTTALHWAVQEDRLDLVKLLLVAGAKANARNQYGLTPLALALTKGNLRVVEHLLEAGADPQVHVPEMGPALFAASHIGNPDVIELLLKAGVNANETEPGTGQTALMWAAAEGHAAAVKALLVGGADFKVRSSKSDTALFFAVRKGDIGVVDALLAAGADVNERTVSETTNARNGAKETVPGNTMLVVAILNAHFTLADHLLEKGADPNAAGAQWTPLHTLSRVRDYEEHQYPPPLIKPGEMDSLEFGKRLLAHGADPNISAQTTTAKRGPGDQNYKDLIGATPFFLAAKSGDIPYMRMLLGAGADPTKRTNDHTSPIMVAAGIGCVPGQWIEPERDILATVKLLVEELKAGVNETNDQKETAVNGAMCRGADSVVQYLADKGARFDIKDVEGRTPLDKAINGLYLPVSINSKSPLNIWRPPDHTALLVRKLTEAGTAQASVAP